MLLAAGREGALQSVVAYCEALVCCAWRPSGVKMISWRGREVYTLEGLPSSPKEGGLLSDSLTGACVTCGCVVVHCLCRGGGCGGSTDGSISTE